MATRSILSLVCFILCSVANCELLAQLVPPDTTEGKTEISYDSEPFANFAGGDGGAGFVKFSVILSQPGTAYFQDSNLRLFHYDFASQHLQPFVGYSREQFDAVSLHLSGQQVVL